MNESDSIEAAFERWLELQSRHSPAEEREFFAALDPEIATALRLRVKTFKEACRMIGLAGVIDQDIGGYRLVSEVGRGATGIVWRAESDGGDTVALKLLYFQHMGNHEVEARLEREGAILKQLRHQGIVAFRHMGSHLGMPYLVTELIDPPRTLADILDSWRIRERRDHELFSEIAGIFAQICRALDFAHSNGVLHRDLSPRNILIDREFRPRLTDFGMASRGTDVTLTASGQIIGTIRYMSPEHADPSLGDLSKSSDTFSIGTMLFEALARRSPFKGETLTETRRELVIGDPPTPRSIDPSIPRRLSDIAVRAISHGPSHRYASAAELADDLESFANPSVRPGGSRRTRSFLSRKYRRYPRTTIAVVLSATVGIVALAVLGQLRAASVQVVEANHEQERTRYETRLLEGHVQLANGSPRAALRTLDDAPERLRGWAFQHLMARADSSIDRSRLHSGAVLALDESPSGSTITVGADARVTVSDPARGQTPRRFALEDGARRAVVSPNGVSILVATPSHRLQVWSTWGEIRFDQSRSSIEWCDWIDDRTVLVSTLSGDLEVLDLELPSAPRSLGRWSVVGPVVGARSIRSVVSTAKDRTLRVWNLDGSLRSTADPGSALIIGVHWDSRSNSVFAVDGEGDVYHWRTDSNAAERLTLAHPAKALAIDPEGRYLSYITPESEVHLHRISDGVSVPLVGARSSVSTLAFSQDGGRVLVGETSGHVARWSACTVGAVTDWMESRFSITALESSADGKRLAVSTRVGATYLFDAHSGGLLRRLATHGGAATCMAFARDVPLLVTSGPDGQMHVLDTHLDHVVSHADLGMPIRSISLSPDGESVVAADRDGRLFLGTGRANSLDLIDPARRWKVRFCRYINSNRAVVVRACQDGDGVQWRADLLTPSSSGTTVGQRFSKLVQGSGRPTALAVDPAGSVAVAVDLERVVLIDVESATVRYTYEASAPVSAIALSRPLFRLFVAEGDELAVLDLVSPQPRIRIRADGMITQLAVPRLPTGALHVVLDANRLQSWEVDMPRRGDFTRCVERTVRWSPKVHELRDRTLGNSDGMEAAIRELAVEPGDRQFILAHAAALGALDAREINELAWAKTRRSDVSRSDREWALKALTQASKLDSMNGFIHHSLGVAALHLEEWDVARKALLRSEDLDRDLFGGSRSATLAYLAVALRACGDVAGSEARLAQAEALASGDGERTTKESLSDARGMLERLKRMKRGRGD